MVSSKGNCSPGVTSSTCPSLVSGMPASRHARREGSVVPSTSGILVVSLDGTCSFGLTALVHPSLSSGSLMS